MADRAMLVTRKKQKGHHPGKPWQEGVKKPVLWRFWSTKEGHIWQLFKSLPDWRRIGNKQPLATFQNYQPDQREARQRESKQQYGFGVISWELPKKPDVYNMLDKRVKVNVQEEIWEYREGIQKKHLHLREILTHDKGDLWTRLRQPGRNRTHNRRPWDGLHEMGMDPTKKFHLYLDSKTIPKEESDPSPNQTDTTARYASEEIWTPLTNWINTGKSSSESRIADDLNCRIELRCQKGKEENKNSSENVTSERSVAGDTVPNDSYCF